MVEVTATPAAHRSAEEPHGLELRTPEINSPQISLAQAEPVMTPGARLTPSARMALLEKVAVSPGHTPSVSEGPPAPAPAPLPPPAVVEDPELEEEMAGVREEYLMDLFTNCQTCLDPISGEKLLVADLSYTIRLLSVEERYNLRAENELANDIEDNLLFERRSATTVTERTIVGSEDNAGLFSRGDDDDVSKDGSSILLTVSSRPSAPTLEPRVHAEARTAKCDAGEGEVQVLYRARSACMREDDHAAEDAILGSAQGLRGPGRGFARVRRPGELRGLRGHPDPSR